MPAVATEDSLSTGHEGYPPTGVASVPDLKTKIGGKKPLVKHEMCYFAPHSKPYNPTHTGPGTTPLNRGIVGYSSKTKIRGFPVARISDAIACGDMIADGSSTTFME